MGYATTGLAAMDCNDSRFGCKAVPFLANASYDASCFLERLKQILRVERKEKGCWARTKLLDKPEAPAQQRMYMCFFAKRL